LVHGCLLITMVGQGPPFLYWIAFRAGAQWSQMRHFSIHRDRTMITRDEDIGTA
jgi:hypothetical protein